MQYRLLGGLEVRDGERQLDLVPAKQRAVLAVLLLEPCRRPRDAATVLITQPPGYRLAVDRRSVDVFRLEEHRHG